MEIEQIAIGAIKPYEKNPREIPQSAIDAVKKSIAEFGWRQPVVVDKDMVLVVGHTRLLAAQEMGMDKVPVHVAADLTEAQARAYRLADNKSGEFSSWMDEMLSGEMQELDALDFDLALTGFGDEEIASLLNNENEGLTDEDETPPLPDEPVSVPGNVWALGNHRLMCGDSTSADDVAVLLGDVKPHLMVTDPPYGVEYDANWRNEADRANGKPYGRAIGKVDNDDNADWVEAWALFPGDVAYVWHDGKKANIVADSLIASDLQIRAQIVWVKNNIAIGRGDYHWKHEPCWYAVRKGKPGQYHGGRKQSTVWEIDKPLKSETGHSTQKPVECMRRPIENNSSPGQAVYEPFSGSGTTIIAGENTGRHIYAMEINPAYVDMAVTRWENFTGLKAELISSTETNQEAVNA